MGGEAVKVRPKRGLQRQRLLQSGCTMRVLYQKREAQRGVQTYI
jgi:hypothetical protein